MAYFTRLITFSVVILVACAPKVDPPAINSAVSPLNLEPCRKVQLNLKHLEANQLREFVDCINGDKDGIRPYKDLLDSVSDSDLGDFLEIYNRHVISNTDHRFNSFIGQLEDIEKKGFLKSLTKNLQVLVENNVLSNGLPPLKRFLEDEKNRGALDEKVSFKDDFLIKLIDENLVGSSIVALANLLGGTSAKVLATLLSTDNPQSPMHSDQVTDILADTLMRSYDDKTHLQLLTALTDPQILSSFKLLSDVQIDSIAALFAYLPKDSMTRGTTRMNRMRLAVKGANRSVTCYKGSNSVRHSDNLLKFIIAEGNKLPYGTTYDNYYLKAVPLLVSMTYGHCDYSEDLLKNIGVFLEIIKDGYGDGLHALDDLLIKSQRFDNFEKALESDYHIQLATIYEELANRRATPFLFHLASQDLTSKDISNLAVVLNHFVSEDRKGISFEYHFVSLMKKVLVREEEPRREIKNLVGALSNTLGDKRGGIGELFVTLAQISSGSDEKPFQSLFKDILKDKDLNNRILTLVIKHISNPNLVSAIKFTGEIAGNGQLERLFLFLVELLKNKDEPGLNPGPSNAPYKKSDVNINQTISGQKPFQIKIPPGNWLNTCLNLHGFLFEITGENMFKGLQCINVGNSTPELGTLSEKMKSKGLLDELSEVLTSIMYTSPFYGGGLNELETIFRNGQLRQILKLVSISSERPYSLPYRLDDILADAFSHPSMGQTLKLVGKVASLKDLSQVGQTFLEVISQKPQKSFFSDSQFKFEIENERALRARLDELMPNLNQSQRDQAYRLAAKNYEEHNDDWFYTEGPFEKLDDRRWKQEIVLFFRNLLKTTDLPELVLALQSIGADQVNPLVKFLKEAIHSQRMTVFYDKFGVARPHILTQFDQMDVLVRSAQFGLLGIDDVGLGFKHAVADSNHLVTTMWIVKNGLRTVALPAAKLSELNAKEKPKTAYVKNMLAHFQVLDEIAANGNLKIIQKLYRALKKSTPDPYKNSYDPTKSHMSNFDHINNVGFFTFAGMGLASLDKQGKLKEFVDSLFGVIALITPEDFESLRQLVASLTLEAEKGNYVPMEVLLDKVLEISRSTKSFQEFKDTLFSLVLALNRVGVKPAGLIKAIPPLAGSFRTWNDLLDQFIEGGQQADSLISSIGSNLMKVSPGQLLGIQNLMRILFVDDPKTDSVNLLPSLAKVYANTYELHSEEFKALAHAGRVFSQDLRVKAIDPTKLFSEVFKGFEGKSGIGDGLGYILANDLDRHRVLDLVDFLAHEKQISVLSRLIIRKINDGGLDKGFHFIFDNLTPGPVGLNNKNVSETTIRGH